MAKLIFVYQNNENFMNEIFSFFHKVMQPNTHLSLSKSVNDGYIGMKKAWKSYFDWLPVSKEFFSESQFQNTFPDQINTSCPRIYLQQENKRLEEIISSSELENEDLAKLTTLLNERVVSCRLKKQV